MRVRHWSPDVQPASPSRSDRPLRRFQPRQRALDVLLGALLGSALMLLAGSFAAPPGQSQRIGPSSSGPERVMARLSASADAADGRVWDYAAAPAAKCPPPRQVLTVDDVAFGILTSERFLETRLASQQRTWLRRVRHAVFYSESAIARLPTVRLTPPPREELVGGGAWKNFPALIDLYRRFPRAKWVFFNDDDTYVFVSNLLLALSRMDPKSDVYFGLYWTPRIDLEWREVKIAYASGGGGYALSNHLLRRLAPIMPGCQANYTRWAGDLRVGKCISDLGVTISPATGFHHEGHDKYAWSVDGGGWPYGHRNKRASAATLSPVTFHHLDVDHLSLYERMSYAEARGEAGELYRWDFSPWFLKEFVGFAPKLRHRVKLFFGVGVDVAASVDTPWRRDFGDPLYIRPLVDAAGRVAGRRAGASFHMAIAKVPEIFNGDGCSAAVDDPHRHPLRKTAVVEIRCTPCGGGATAPAAAGELCAIYREDACTLKLELSMRCPRRELVYAPTLDVGTTPGGAELVSAGVAASCGRAAERPRASASASASAASAPADAAWVGGVRSVAGEPLALYARLTHGDLGLAPALLAASAGCSASFDAPDGRDVVAAIGGGTMRASAGPQRLGVRCVCPRARRANVTLTLRLLDYTSTVVSYAQECEGAAAG